MYIDILDYIGSTPYFYNYNNYYLIKWEIH